MTAGAPLVQEGVRCATMTSERPILFSGEMIRSILAGKTQTRRVVNMDRLKAKLPREVASEGPIWMIPGEGVVAPPNTYKAHMNPQGAVSIHIGRKLFGVKPGEFDFVCPYASGHTCHVAPDEKGGPWVIAGVGDKLWVRETFGIANGNGHRTVYRADLGTDRWPASVSTEHAKWRPSIHMPRWASRITLEVLRVRVERLQDITEQDAVAEGFTELGLICRTVGGGCIVAREFFRKGWDELNAKRGYPWDDNPWVWVVEFRRLDGGE